MAEIAAPAADAIERIRGVRGLKGVPNPAIVSDPPPVGAGRRLLGVLRLGGRHGPAGHLRLGPPAQEPQLPGLHGRERRPLRPPPPRHRRPRARPPGPHHLRVTRVLRHRLRLGRPRPCRRRHLRAARRLPRRLDRHRPERRRPSSSWPSPPCWPSSSSRPSGSPARLLKLTIIFAVAGTPSLFRVIRATTLSFATREFVVAARTMGATTRRILFRELLPERHPGGGVLRPHRRGRRHHPGGIAGLPRPVDLAADGVAGQHHQRGGPEQQPAMNPYIALWPSIYIFLLLVALNLMADRLRAPLRRPGREPVSTPATADAAPRLPRRHRARGAAPRRPGPAHGLPHRPRPGEGQRRRLVHLGPGQDPRGRGRVGLGQDRAHPVHHGPAPQRQPGAVRIGPLRRPRADEPDAGPAPRRVGHPDVRHLPGPHDGAQPGRPRRPPADRVAAHPARPRPPGRPRHGRHPAHLGRASPLPSSACAITPTSSRAACASAS